MYLIIYDIIINIVLMEEEVLKKILGQIRAAVDRYNLIDEGDKIAIGVSGGKDSLVLLEALNRLKEFYDKKFQIVALILDPQFNGVKTDFSLVEERMKNLNIDYEINRSLLGEIIFKERKEKNPCSLCAKMRRGILHNMSKSHGCNKIALGHHYDDAVQTFFMNLFNSGRIGCFSPKSYLSRKDIWIIRPMIFCRERDILSFANRNRMPVVKSLCPADGVTSRKKTEDLIKNLEKTYPDLRSKVIGALQRRGIDNW